jgi:hypothetical protein
MIEHATANRERQGRRIWREHLRDRQSQQRGHGHDTTGHSGPRRATGCETVSLPLAKARTKLLALEQ